MQQPSEGQQSSAGGIGSGQQPGSQERVRSSRQVVLVWLLGLLIVAGSLDRLPDAPAMARSFVDPHATFDSQEGAGKGDAEPPTERPAAVDLLVICPYALRRAGDSEAFRQRAALLRAAADPSPPFYTFLSLYG